MNRVLVSPRVAFVVALLLVGAAAFDAQAYLDPGTGSFILQVLIAGVLGMFFALKLYWNRFTGFVLRRSRKPEEKPDDDE